MSRLRYAVRLGVGFIEQLTAERGEEQATTLAAYFVAWAPPGAHETHEAHLDLVLGAWGPGSTPEDRVLVAWLLRPPYSGFVLIDGSERPVAGSPELAGHVAGGDQVGGSELEGVAHALAAHILQHDDRLTTLRAQMGDR